MNLKKVDFDQIQSYIQKYNSVVDLADQLNTKPDLLIDALLKVGFKIFDKTKEGLLKEFLKNDNPDAVKFIENLTLFLKSNGVKK